MKKWSLLLVHQQKCSILLVWWPLFFVWGYEARFEPLFWSNCGNYAHFWNSVYCAYVDFWSPKLTKYKEFNIKEIFDILRVWTRFLHNMPNRTQLSICINFSTSWIRNIAIFSAKNRTNSSSEIREKDSMNLIVSVDFIDFTRFRQYCTFFYVFCQVFLEVFG